LPPHVRRLDELVETLENEPGLGRLACGSPVLTVHGDAPSPVRITLFVAHQ
jgi:hypothetical protein